MPKRSLEELEWSAEAAEYQKRFDKFKKAYFNIETADFEILIKTLANESGSNPIALHNFNCFLDKLTGKSNVIALLNNISQSYLTNSNQNLFRGWQDLIVITKVIEAPDSKKEIYKKIDLARYLLALDQVSDFAKTEESNNKKSYADGLFYRYVMTSKALGDIKFDNSSTQKISNPKIAKIFDMSQREVLNALDESRHAAYFDQMFFTKIYSTHIARASQKNPDFALNNLEKARQDLVQAADARTNQIKSQTRPVRLTPSVNINKNHHTTTEATSDSDVFLDQLFNEYEAFTTSSRVTAEPLLPDSQRQHKK